MILSVVREEVSRTATLDFQKADFSLLKDLGERSWEVVLKGKGVWESRAFLKNEILKASCSQNTQPPELREADMEQDEASIIQWKTLDDLLHLKNVDKSMGMDGIHPRVMKELVEVLAMPLSIV